jgi:hypothetical protein
MSYSGGDRSGRNIALPKEAGKGLKFVAADRKMRHHVR